ncbi:type II secretion system protein [Candidatus Woesebacteria bacterium]|nr:type II secretion system protein [Candidatus Woesebacteria bacterium]
MFKLKYGFTLIEMLVVITIISVLLAISLFGIQGVRESSRDAKRKSDLQLIASGLELYKSDCNKYPSSLPVSGPLVGDGSSTTCLSANTYISAVPTDPVTGRSYNYFYLSPNSYKCFRWAGPSPCTQQTQFFPTSADCNAGCTNDSGCTDPPFCSQVTGGTYEICAALENVSGSTATDCGGDSTCGSATCNYKVTNS